MKNLTINKNNHFLRLEKSNQTCQEILTSKSKAIRFDILLDDGEDVIQMWRGEVALRGGKPMLELKDYRDNQRFWSALDSLDHVSDASTIALNLAWRILNTERAISPVGQP